MKREIILDTETTGFSPQTGDRIVEIGCVELINHIPTGKTHHTYVNPEREMPESAFKVHGLSDEFLSDKPLFIDVVDAFLDFIGDATLVIHNAEFDMGFLNFELEQIGKPQLTNEIVDTVRLARKIHPGARVSLDALCKHHGIDNSRRDLHGALLDSQILAEVYLELLGGRQVALSLNALDGAESEGDQTAATSQTRQRPLPLPERLTADERAAHDALVDELSEEAIWRRYGA